MVYRKTKFDGASNPNSPESQYAIPGNTAKRRKLNANTNQKIESMTWICDFLSFLMIKKNTSAAQTIRTNRKETDTVHHLNHWTNRIDVHARTI